MKISDEELLRRGFTREDFEESECNEYDQEDEFERFCLDPNFD